MKSDVSVNSRLIEEIHVFWQRLEFSPSLPIPVSPVEEHLIEKKIDSFIDLDVQLFSFRLHHQARSNLLPRVGPLSNACERFESNNDVFKGKE